MNKNDEKRKQINEDPAVDPCDTCQYRKDRTMAEAKADNFLVDADEDGAEGGTAGGGDGGRQNTAANGNTSSGDGRSNTSKGDSGRPAFSEAECRQRCKRSFWTEFLRTIAKVAGVVLAAFGLQNFDQTD